MIKLFTNEPQGQIDDCLDCKLPECVHVDPEIDALWCALHPSYKKVLPVNKRWRQRYFSSPTSKTLDRLKRIIDNHDGEISASKIADKAGLSYMAISNYLASGYLQSVDGSAKRISGVNYDPNGGMEIEHLFTAIKKTDTWLVYYLPSGGKHKNLFFQSKNPYLAIAAIAMKLAKKYGDQIE